MTKWILSAVLASTLVKLMLASHSYGTNDMIFYELSWRKSLEADGGIGLYRNGVRFPDSRGKPYHFEDFMNPPFVIHLMRAAGWMSGVAGGTFAFWMRVPSILADAGIVLLLTRLTWHRLALLLVALSPVSLLVSGFHGSTDSLMMLLVLLSVMLLQRESALLGGLAFGLGLNIKIWPVVLIPAILAWLPDRERRTKFAAAAAGMFALSGMPFLMQDPVLVATRLLAYGSLFGNWGVSLILRWLGSATGYTLFSEIFLAVGKYVAVGWCAWLGLWLERSASNTTLAFRAGLIATMFLAITPGFGTQYLVWVLPWTALLGWEFVLLYSFSGAVFAYTLYDHWSDGRWFLANSLVKGPWPGLSLLYGVLPWVAVCVTAWHFWREIRPAPKAAPMRTPPPARLRRKSD